MKTMLGLVLTLVACSGGTNVGGPCNGASDCEAAVDGGPAICITSASTPGGYCSSACPTPGATTGCPANTVCAVYGGGNDCVQICASQKDCRTGYNCNGVTNSSFKACQ